jgi:hypothetical protein
METLIIQPCGPLRAKVHDQRKLQELHFFIKKLFFHLRDDQYENTEKDQPR